MAVDFVKVPPAHDRSSARVSVRSEPGRSSSVASVLVRSGRVGARASRIYFKRRVLLVDLDNFRSVLDEATTWAREHFEQVYLV